MLTDEELEAYLNALEDMAKRLNRNG